MLTCDKHVTKRHFRPHGIPTLRWAGSRIYQYCTVPCLLLFVEDFNGEVIRICFGRADFRMGFSENVLSFSLRTVHWFLWLRESISFMVLWLWTSILYAVKHKGDKLECIQADAKQLKKIPMHLAVVVQEDELSHTDLAKVVAWSFSAGVHNVSLYDPKGESKLRCAPIRISSVHFSVEVNLIDTQCAQ